MKKTNCVNQLWLSSSWGGVVAREGGKEQGARRRGEGGRGGEREAGKGAEGGREGGGGK